MANQYVYTPADSDRGSDMRRQEYVIAMAYVPWQKWDGTFSLIEALDKGTIFPELYKPFLGKEHKKDERY